MPAVAKYRELFLELATLGSGPVIDLVGEQHIMDSGCFFLGEGGPVGEWDIEHGCRCPLYLELNSKKSENFCRAANNPYLVRNVPNDGRTGANRGIFPNGRIGNDRRPGADEAPVTAPDGSAESLTLGKHKVEKDYLSKLTTLLNEELNVSAFKS